ncbi:unnamed protein product, partial [Prorocentrum cordatum]
AIAILGWNSFSLKGVPGRLDHISDTCRAIQIMLYVGAKMRQRTTDASHHLEDSLHHTWVHIGWGRGAHANSSAGCSIAVSKRHFRKIDIVKVLHPLRPDLRGRAGAVELHRGQLRLRLIVAYFPPRPNGAGHHQRWKAGCRRLWSWVLQTLTAAPARVTPILFTDLRQGLGRRSRHLYTDNAIGSYHASDETEFGRFIHDQLLTRQLTAISAHIDVGNTYYGPNKARSRIDYFIGYDNPMEIVKYVKLNCKIHTKLRSLLHVADHVPMIMQIKMPISGVNITNNNIRWDFGLLAAGLQTGAHRVSFLNDVYAEIGKHKEEDNHNGTNKLDLNDSVCLKNALTVEPGDYPLITQPCARSNDAYEHTNDGWIT